MRCYVAERCESKGLAMLKQCCFIAMRRIFNCCLNALNFFWLSKMASGALKVRLW